MSETMADYEDQINASFRSFREGDTVTGEVVSVEAVSYTHLVLETDCPYMAPEPNRGKRNDSSQLIYVAQKLACLLYTSAMMKESRLIFDPYGSAGITWAYWNSTVSYTHLRIIRMQMVNDSFAFQFFL